LLERLNNVSKVQGLLVFVAVEDVAVQPFGKELIKKMSAYGSCSSTAANVPVKSSHPRPHP